MKSARQIWAKAKRDEALNLSELEIVTGYTRESLSAMNLPLQAGKMPLSDFRFILRRRELAHERENPKLHVYRPDPKPPSSPAADEDSPQAIADRFYAPFPKRAGKGASPSPRESRLRGIA